jgi:hypothetical protein
MESSPLKRSRPEADHELLSFKPSAYYFRKALQQSQTLDECREIGRQAVRELEHLKEWVRARGLIPPRRYVLSTEVEEKRLNLRGGDSKRRDDGLAPLIRLGRQAARAFRGLSK